MSIFDKVNEQKKRTEEALARGGSSFPRANFWRPKDGENRVRIMPEWTPALGGQFWREVSQHWNVDENQKSPILCPKNTPDLDGECPICELVATLRTDKSNVEAQALIKEIKAKKAYLLNIVDLADPTYTAKDVAEVTKERPDEDCSFSAGDPKICTYAAPVTVFDHILGVISSNQKDITNLTTGRDIVINKVGNKDRFKTRYNVYPTLDQRDTGYVNVTIPALDKIGFQLDYDKMVALLSNGPAANYGAALFSFDGTTTSQELPAPQEFTSSDLEARMRDELHVT